MDTREKIVDGSEAARRLASDEWTVVPGFFDPLTMVQARRFQALAEPGRKLAAIVLESGDTLLTAEARAALIAALRSVRLVVIAQPRQWRALLPQSGNVRVLEDAQGETNRSAEFVQFIIDRQNATRDGNDRQ